MPRRRRSHGSRKHHRGGRGDHDEEYDDYEEIPELEQNGGGGASSYVYDKVGDGNTQWNNVFNNPGTNNASTGNGLWSANMNQNVSGLQTTDPKLGSLLQGGRRRHRNTIRGGQLMDVIGQAATPAILLAMQQKYRPKRGGRSQMGISKGVLSMYRKMGNLGMHKTHRRKKHGGRKSRRHPKGQLPNL